ncbi:MAG TPA: ABC transporter substrate-binding protein [Streptosporangiaceae bacterium]|nr:ABC transporter substrate-binding protein [Streptosporangiaceae bacterium]
MSRRRRAYSTPLAAVTVAAALLLSACTGSSSGPGSGKPVTGGTVTFAEQPGTPPTYIFPLYNGANSGNNNITYLQPLMWLPLYWFGHPGNALATVNYQLSMADPPVFSGGGKTITIRLKNYRWSDGKPVTSRDIEFWMNLLLQEKNNYAGYVPGGWLDHVAGMSAPDPHTFVLRLSVAYNPTYLLYNGLATITPMPQHAWDKTSAASAAGNYDQTPAGARQVYSFLNKASMSLATWDTNPLWQVVDGPWHLKPGSGFQVTGQTIMLPNRGYSGPGKPKISEFEELPFTSATAEFNALRSGTVDYGYVPTTEVASAGSLTSQGYAVKPWYEWGFTFVSLNFSNPKYAPLENQLYIRQAMQSLINQPVYIKRILLNYGTPTYGPVPTFPQSTFLNPAERNNPYPYSPAAAQRLLTSHGWTIPAGGGPATCARAGTGAGQCGAGIAAGTKLVIPMLYTSGVPEMDAEVQEMQSAFGSSGIGLQLSQAPGNTVLSDSYECIGKTVKTCPASSTALSLFSSPSYTYVPIYYPDGDSLFECNGATNGGDYCNSQVDSLIAQLTTATGAAAQAAFYRYQIFLARQVPVLWFPNAAYQISVISPRLGGVTAQDSTAHIYPSFWYRKS